MKTETEAETACACRGGCRCNPCTCRNCSC